MKDYNEKKMARIVSMEKKIGYLIAIDEEEMKKKRKHWATKLSNYDVYIKYTGKTLLRISYHLNMSLFLLSPVS